MNYRIFGEEKTEQEVILKLDYTLSGGVKVIAVDHKGNRLPCGNLLSFTKDGKIKVHKSVNRNLGFELDPQGRIAIDRI